MVYRSRSSCRSIRPDRRSYTRPAPCSCTSPRSYRAGWSRSSSDLHRETLVWPTAAFQTGLIEWVVGGPQQHNEDFIFYHIFWGGWNNKGRNRVGCFDIVIYSDPILTIDWLWRLFLSSNLKILSSRGSVVQCALNVGGPDLQYPVCVLTNDTVPSKI